MSEEKVEQATLAQMKREGRPITMVTAYDCPTARILDQAGVDTVLTGDSAGNVVLGYPDTIPVSMNPEYMSSTNCEGIDIPLYIRAGERFEPAASCHGSCLTCDEAACGIDDLALNRSGWQKPGFKLADYRRWSRDVEKRSRLQAALEVS